MELVLTAPSRLHFGLYSFGRAEGPQYGGVGAMIERPGLALRATAATAFACEGPRAERADAFARRWAASEPGRELPTIRLTIESAPPEHSGLGSGTQLAMAVAAILHAWRDDEPPLATDVATSVGRGARSAVGAYGFFLGGLIAENGKSPGQAVSEMDVRIDPPSAWRFVLVRPLGMMGCSGAGEVQAFDGLAPVPPETTAALMDEAHERLLPAAMRGDFDAFAASLYRYGRMSGECFSAVQGGAYNGPILTRWIERMRAAGAIGVGQSSWGPTLYAAMPSESAACDFVDRLAVGPNCETTITPICRTGGRIQGGH